MKLKKLMWRGARSVAKKVWHRVEKRASKKSRDFFDKALKRPAKSPI